MTAADIKRVVNKYFTKENRSVAIYTRKAAQKPEGKVKFIRQVIRNWTVSAIAGSLGAFVAVAFDSPRRLPAGGDSRPAGATEISAAYLRASVAGADIRVVLKSGPVAYVVPDRELPLVNIVVYVHTGTYLEPAGKEGLAE